MEKYSKWRDGPTGVQPFTYPLPATATTASVLKYIALPLSWTLGALRMILVLLLLAVHAVVIEGLMSILLVVPPLHAILSRMATTVIVRIVLFLLGFAWISTELVSLKRTARSPPPAPFNPTRGELILANSSSYIDVLYLAFRYNPVFLLPVSSTGTSSPARITSWRRVGLTAALLASGTLPERSERGETLDEALKAARGPCVAFPECTTSNSRAVLRAADLLAPPLSSKSRSLTSYILAFKYPPPTSLVPSATYPIPSTPPLLVHMFALASTPLPIALTVRRLHPSEAPKLSSFPRKEEWDAQLESIAALGRLKRVQMGWENKQAFLEFRKKRR